MLRLSYWSSHDADLRTCNIPRFTAELLYRVQASYTLKTYKRKGDWSIKVPFKAMHPKSSPISMVCSHYIRVLFPHTNGLVPVVNLLWSRSVSVGRIRCGCYLSPLCLSVVGDFISRKFNINNRKFLIVWFDLHKALVCLFLFHNSTHLPSCEGFKVKY